MIRNVVCAWLLLAPISAAAQEHDHAKMLAEASGGGWQVMQDGVLHLEYNDQGSPRGGREFVAPNWWMLMGQRKLPHGTLVLSGMLSLDAATVGTDGYREIFQAGETYQGQPIIDRQHPHDFFMQTAATWNTTVSGSTGLSITGAASGSPALGPVAFMHRASAFDNPMAPLSHHTFDATHISFGVVTAGVTRGRWTIEGSVFNGREPDEHRWDFDFGPLDSVSGRVWFKPTPEWAIQVSTGHLVDPEQAEPGNIERTTATASWTRTRGHETSSITAGYGRNDTDHGDRQAVFVEGARHSGQNTVYARLEILQPEFAHTDTPLTAFSIGAVHNVFSGSGLEGGVGGGVTFNATPAELEPEYGPHPVSFQVFFRLRHAARIMGQP
jgi:hypothetical protein